VLLDAGLGVLGPPRGTDRARTEPRDQLAPATRVEGGHGRSAAVCSFKMQSPLTTLDHTLGKAETRPCIAASVGEPVKTRTAQLCHHVHHLGDDQGGDDQAGDDQAGDDQGDR
jgi:hypothetical protein